MKKTIFKLLGTSLIAASVFGFVSCGDSTEYDAKIDTVYSLNAPSVTAKAYPGVNYISWDPVTSAQGYKIYGVQDGVHSSLRTVASDVTCYADIAASDHILADGKEYKYIVEAVSKSDPASREVYVQNSQGSASVRAIVPAAGSPAISAEPVSYSGKDYIKNYYEKLVTKASENVKLSITTDGIFCAEYPATAGFEYKIAALPKGQYDALGGDVSFASPVKNYKEDYKAELKTPVTCSSEFEVYLKVSSVSDLYKPVDVKLGSLTAESIGESESIKKVSAKYVASKNAVVSWKPAKLESTGEYSPVTNFKVYRTSSDDATWKALSAEVKKISEIESVSSGSTTLSTRYYIEDTVESDSISYKYYVVHTDGKLFGTYNESSNMAELSAVTLTKTADPTLSVSTFTGSTAGLKTIKIASAKENENQTLELSYVKLAEDADGDAVEYILSNFTSLELANHDGYEESYINYIEADAGTYLVKLTAYEEGKKDKSVYEIVIVSPAEALGSSLEVSSDGTKVTVTENIAKDSKVDSVANYKYTLYKVVSTESKDYSDSVSVVTTNLGEVALAYPAGVTSYCEKEIPDTEVAGSANLYYVVKARVSDPSIFVKVSNE